MASPYADKVIADGAVLYLRLDETSGTTATSKVGGYTGTISGGVTLGQTGALADGNRAMAFDGSNDRIALTNGGYAAVGTGPVTLEIWIRASQPPTGSYLFECASNPCLRVLFDASVIYFRPHDGTTQYEAFFAWAAYRDNLWHHLVCCISRGTTDVMQMYMDGVQKASVPIAVAGKSFTTAGAVSIGAHTAAVGGWLGSLDEVAIYHTALTPQQIAAHYALRTATGMPAWHDLRYRYCRFVRAPGWRRSA